jgi:hypothetical protein
MVVLGQWSKKMRPDKLTLIIVVVFSLLVGAIIIGCSAGPSALMTLSPGKLNEPVSVPSSYTTYTEPGVYRVSYPSEWIGVAEVGQEAFRIEFQKKFRESVKSESAIPATFMTPLFAGTARVPEVRPSFEVQVGPPIANMQEYIDGTEKLPEAAAGVGFSSKELSRSKVMVNGEDAFLWETQFKGPNSTQRHIYLYFPGAKNTWGIYCQMSEHYFSKYIDDFTIIMRSFNLVYPY